MAQLLASLFDISSGDEIAVTEQPGTRINSGNSMRTALRNLPFLVLLPVFIYGAYTLYVLSQTLQAYRSRSINLNYALMSTAAVLVVLWIVFYSVTHGKPRVAWFICLVPIITDIVLRIYRRFAAKK